MDVLFYNRISTGRVTRKLLLWLLFCPLIATTLQAADDLYPIRLDGIWGYMDRNGQVQIEPQYEQAGNFFSDLAAVRVDGLWGFINKSGQMIIKAQFDDAEPFSEGLSLVRLCDRYGYIDTSGRYLINPFYNQAQPFASGLAFVETRSEKYLIDRNETVMLRGFDKVKRFREGLAPARREGRWGFIDNKGTWVIKAKFKAAEAFSDGMALVKDRNNLYGWISKTGDYVIKPKYEIMGENNSAFNLNRAAVMDKSRWGYINREGKLVIAAQYNWAEPFVNGLARVYKDDRVYYIDPEGNLVWDPDK